MVNRQFPEPYRLFFPLGLIAAILGTLVWPLANHGFVAIYPKQVHGGMLFLGFFWTFILGFLMSAVPRMTFTEPASRSETGLAITLALAQMSALLSSHDASSATLFLLQMVALLIFLGRRLVPQGKLPFDGFVFIPFAFGMSAYAALNPLLSPAEENGAGGFSHFMLFGLQAMVLNLICGVGSRMIPVLLRVPSSLTPLISSVGGRRLELAAFALAINLTFFTDSLIIQGPIRAVILAAFAIRHLKVLAKSSTRSFLAWGVRASVSAVILGYFFLGFHDDQLAAQHVVFISGLTLVTLMVASRITLTHDEQNMNLELSNKAILAITLLLPLTAGLRLLLRPGLEQGSLLDLTAGLFICSIALWGFTFGKFLSPFKEPGT